MNWRHRAGHHCSSTYSTLGCFDQRSTDTSPSHQNPSATHTRTQVAGTAIYVHQSMMLSRPQHEQRHWHLLFLFFSTYTVSHKTSHFVVDLQFLERSLCFLYQWKQQWILYSLFINSAITSDGCTADRYLQCEQPSSQLSQKLLNDSLSQFLSKPHNVCSIQIYADTDIDVSRQAFMFCCCQFLQRMRTAVIATAYLSVRLSVTFRCFVQINEDTIVTDLAVFSLR